ncbi:MAG: integrase [Archaeoglobaceae archaeon]
MKAHNKSSQHLNPYDVVVNEKVRRCSAYRSSRGSKRTYSIMNEVPESVANFIQGRASTTVGSAHYLAKTVQADNCYSKVVDGLIDALKPKALRIFIGFLILSYNPHLRIND